MKAFNGTTKELEKYTSVVTSNGVKCKCNHTIIFYTKSNKEICSWCGRYVFRTKKDEFEYRLKERMRKNARKQ